MSSQQNGIEPADWPEIQPRMSRRQSRTAYRDGLNTGVRVMSDGRLDIRFREHKPWLAKLLHHLQHQPHAAPEENRRPSIQVPPGEDRCPLRLNIVIQVVGSRGDVQPFIALGQTLKSYGHRIRLATHLPFRDAIHDANLEFFDIGGDPAELMAFMVKNPGLMPDMSTIRSGAIRKRRREMKTIFSGCWRSCYETGDGTGLHHIAEDPWSETLDYQRKPFVADAIIANPPSFAHLSCAEKLGVPLNMMFTMPWTPTQAFPHPLANVTSHSTKPSVANFASYTVVEVMMWEGLGDLINRFRKRELGLDPLDAIRAPSIGTRLQVPYTYLWSPALLPKPQDWSQNIDVVGFSFPQGSDYTPPDDLDAFLKAGEPPIYVGFGSIVVDNPTKLTKVVFGAIRETGVRAIVSKGWGNIGEGEAEIPDNIFMIGKCPHDWLFPRCSLVIHHGGAGTTAAGLVLGRPTIIVPFFGDQPFWGSIVERAGAGPPPVPYKQLTAEKLAAAIRMAQDPKVAEKAQEIGKKMRTESGVRNAACSFHRHLNYNDMRCAICPKRPAVWWVRRSHIRLSTFAAAVLVETGLLKPHNVVLYRSKNYDTNRNPRGPISAGAEVLYGLVTDLVSDLASLPMDVGDMFSHEKHRQYKGHYERKMLKNKIKDRLKEAKRGHPSLDSGIGNGRANDAHPESTNGKNKVNGTDGRPNGNYNNTASNDREENANSHHPDNESQSRSGSQDSAYASAEETAHDASSATTISDSAPPDDDPISRELELDLERTLTRRRTKEQRGTAREALDETRYHTSRFAKQVLNYTIKLPTDLTLSLSKGFHNAPRLYHDTTVEDCPRVLGMRSGFRAAGTEITHSIFHGVTGLGVLPVLGLRESGGRGLVKGIGKGMGGFVLKPIAGIWGLAGYPLDGIHKSLRHSLTKVKTKDIIASRMEQGLEEMCVASPDERAFVIRRWHELVQDNRPSSAGSRRQ